MLPLLQPASAGARPYSRGVDNQTKHIRWNAKRYLNHSEHVGGDGAKPASPDHPRRAPPLRISAGMSEFDGRRGGGQARVGAGIREPPAGFRKGATTSDSRGRPP